MCYNPAQAARAARQVSMNQSESNLGKFKIAVTAHQEGEEKHLMVSVETEDSQSEDKARIDTRVAIVIDRSGSMSHGKLEMAKSATAQFIRSLKPEDRVAIVAYDDEVECISELAAPSEELAARVEAIQTGNATNLYGGWKLGTQLVGEGGHVILLSDGQANKGKFKDALSLSEAARHQYDHGVTTTTIGVGKAYDEAVMAGMAREGGGSHYFAHTVEAIKEAFSQERYAVGAIVLSRLDLFLNERQHRLGSFWEGERKTKVIPCPAEIESLQLVARWTEAGSLTQVQESIQVPPQFGYSETVKLELLLQRAADAQADMVTVREPVSARKMREVLRSIVLELMSHPSSDEQHVLHTLERLRASITKLEQLESHFDENEATLHRKRSLQMSHNLRERAKSFSSFDDDVEFLASTTRRSRPTVVAAVEASDEALAAYPLHLWIEWKAIPLKMTETNLTVAMSNPKRGFTLDQIEKITGRRVRAVAAGYSDAQVVGLLESARGRI